MTRESVSTNPVLGFFRALGVLRVALILLGLFLMVMSPTPGEELIRHGWGLITTAVIPAMTPMVFMVLLLDMLMNRVLMSEAPPEERRRRWLALGTVGLVATALLVSWIPFLDYLFNR